MITIVDRLKDIREKMLELRDAINEEGKKKVNTVVRNNEIMKRMRMDINGTRGKGQDNRKNTDV